MQGRMRISRNDKIFTDCNTTWPDTMPSKIV